MSTRKLIIVSTLMSNILSIFYTFWEGHSFTYYGWCKGSCAVSNMPKIKPPHKPHMQSVVFDFVASISQESAVWFYFVPFVISVDVFNKVLCYHCDIIYDDIISTNSYTSLRIYNNLIRYNHNYMLDILSVKCVSPE